MNILYTIFSFNIGGAEKLLVDILNNWDENDRIYLCIINNLYNQDLINKIKSKDNIEIVYLNRKPKSKNIGIIIQYLKLIMSKKIDIIHCQSLNAFRLSFIGKILNRNLKVFLTIHATNTFNKYSYLDKYLISKICDKVIAISNCVKQEITNSGLNNQKVEVVYNGIDFSHFNISKQPHENINISCIARLDYLTKGQDILLKAIAIVKEIYPNIKCYLAGSYDTTTSSDYEFLKNLTVELNIEDNIVFLGNVNDIPSLLSRTDIFVLPSRYEGFGLSLVEAMYCRIPVISSNVEGPKEIIQNIYGSLFDVGEYHQLAKLLIENIENRNEECIDKAFLHVSNTYNITQMINKLKIIYNS